MSSTKPARKLDEFAKLVIALYIAPIPFELAFGLVKREQYDFRRLVILIGAVTVLVVVMGLLRTRRRWYLQTVVGGYVVIVGVAIATLGIFLTIRGDRLFATSTWLAGLNATIGALTPTLGGVMAVAGVMLIYERHKRAKHDFEAPPPEAITQVRVKAIGTFTGSTWQASDITGSAGERLIAICRAALDIVDLHFVAFFDNAGECQFYVDVLDDHELATKARGDTSERRYNYIRHARQLRRITTDVDIRLRDLHAGKLVRTVLDVEQGALYLYDLGEVGFLFGVTLDQVQVDPTDWKLSDLANAMLRAHGRQEDDDFYRYCPICRTTNRHSHNDDTVVPLQRPRNGSAG